MTTRIDIIAPATIALLGSLVESADPVNLAVVGAAAGTLSVVIIAGNAGASLSASAAAGATAGSNANTLTVTGTQAQVNAALASLQLTDAGNDTLQVSVSGAGALSAASDIVVQKIPPAGPAFAAPPASFALSPYSISNIGGLVLADPAALALAAAGLGAAETMAVTLSAASGVLFLPGYTAMSGIMVTGAGTPELFLQFTADQLPAVNALLAGLEWSGPAAVSGLAYAARDVSGPLGATVTSGNLVLEVTGTQGPVVSLTTGADTAILGVSSFSLGAVLDVTGSTADIGGINGQGSVFINPGAALEVPYNLLSLSGTSYDFGNLAGLGLNETGALLAAGGAVFSGPVNIGSAGEVDFTGSLIAGAADVAAGNLDISIGPGAVVTGSGNLVAGNFSESGAIGGAGSIMAGSGDTLVIAAGQISGVALQVAAGGVLQIGPVDPLYGVFAATPLTISPAMTLSFLNDSGGLAATGAFADTLAPTGGVIVITSPELFAGTIVNFSPGDRLIFPGLSYISLSSISATGFVASGPDASGITQSYTIKAAIAAGASPFVGTDAAGDAEVSLRDAQPDVFLAGSTVTQTALVAQPGTAQLLTGFDILARSWTGQSLAVTLAVSHGVLSGPGIASAAQVIVTAANPAALNVELQALSYTANGTASGDLMVITSSAAPLSGLQNFLPISMNRAGGSTVSYFGDTGQGAMYTDNAAMPVQAVAAPGALEVTGTKIFDTVLNIPGLGGAALWLTSGAAAVFDTGSATELGADVSVAGAALLAVLSDAFSISGNVTDAGSLIVTGALTASGNLLVGGSVFTSGSIKAGGASIAAGGLFAEAGGTVVLTALTVSGTLTETNASRLAVGSAAIAGMLELGGTATFGTANPLVETGTIIIGPDAALLAPGLSQSGGVMTLAGYGSFGNVMSDAVISLSGGTLLSPWASLQPGGVIAGGGVIGAGITLGALNAAGLIVAAGDLLIADDVTLASGGSIAIAALSTLDIVHAVSGGTIGFAGANAELIINDVAQFSAAVAGMVDHDAIDLVGVATSQVSFAGGEVGIQDQNGVALGAFALGIAAGQPGVSLSADDAGGSLITLGGDMPCFARGTCLLTPNGYRAVERLAPGDPVITYGGDRRAVRWIGWRTLDLRTHDKAGPVLFAPHCIAPGVPLRPVWLSPLHAVMIGGVLVPACHLVNGATITQPRQAAITYFHIELDRHDVLLADGMPAESYLDTGNRGQLYSEIGVRGTARRACAELVTSGGRLAMIRRRLHEIALQAGYRLTFRPVLRGVAGQIPVLPRKAWCQGRRELRFAFPTPVSGLSLTAQSCAPADTDPDSEDRRPLGVCLAGLPAGVRFQEGWFAPDKADAGIWMGAVAELAFSGLRDELTLALNAVIQSWQPPAPTVMRKPLADDVRPSVDLKG